MRRKFTWLRSSRRWSACQWQSPHYNTYQTYSWWLVLYCACVLRRLTWQRRSRRLSACWWRCPGTHNCTCVLRRLTWLCSSRRWSAFWWRCRSTVLSNLLHMRRKPDCAVVGVDLHMGDNPRLENLPNLFLIACSMLRMRRRFTWLRSSLRLSACWWRWTGTLYCACVGSPDCAVVCIDLHVGDGAQVLPILEQVHIGLTQQVEPGSVVHTCQEGGLSYEDSFFVFLTKFLNKQQSWW